MVNSNLALVTPPADDAALPDPHPVLARLAGGERLLLTDTESGQRLALASRSGQVLFEYDTSSGCVRISGAVTSVALASSAADVELRSEGNLALVARGGVSIRSASAVTLEVQDGTSSPSARASVTPHGISLAARQLDLMAERARASWQRAELCGQKLRARWESAQLSSQHLELEARNVRSKLHTVMQEVEGSLSLRAGRVRQWIRGSHHTRVERSELLATEDVRINGKRINLG